jgi:predicted small metal-binding protein
MQACTKKEQGENRLAGYRRSLRSFSLCRDLGLDCSHQTTGTTNNEILRNFIEHAGTAHHMDVLTADILYRIQKALQK